MLNVAELGRDVGISAPTAKKWLSVLQASNQVFLLEPYYRSLGKRISKTPKLYFTDTGLAAYLMGFGSPHSLWASRNAGALWENYVVSQWLRRRDWHEPSLGLWTWRDQGGNEVDLVLEKEGRLIPIECKLAERPESKDVQGIRKLKAFYGEEAVLHAYIACPMDMPYGIASGVTAVPGWEPWPIPKERRR
jgi:predicted AAA+ superfamily ATPase